MTQQVCKFVSRPTCLQCIKEGNMISEGKKPAYYQQFTGLRSCSGCMYINKYIIEKSDALSEK